MKAGIVREIVFALIFFTGGVILAFGKFWGEPVTDGALRDSERTQAEVEREVPGSKNPLETANDHEPLTHEGIAAFAAKLAQCSSSAEHMVMALEWIQSLKGEDFELIVADLEGSVSGEGSENSAIASIFETASDNEALLLAFFEQWAVNSPDSLTKLIESTESEEMLEMAQYALPFLWMNDREGASRAIELLKDRLGTYFFDGDVFAQLLYLRSEVDAVRWALESGAEYDLDVSDLFERGISDGDGIFAELSKIGDEDEREEVMEKFFEGYTRQNPDGAKALLDSLAEGEFKDDMVEMVMSTWALEDPASRLNFYSKDYDGTDVLEQWLKNDPEAVLAWTEAHADDATIAGKFAGQVYGNRDALPFDFFIEHGDAATSMGIDLIFDGFFDGFLEALTDEQFERVGSKYPERFSLENYTRFPQEALDSFASSDSEYRDAYFTMISAAAGADGLIDWLRSLGREELELAMPGFFEEWTRSDPEAAFVNAQEETARITVAQSWLQYEDAEIVYLNVRANMSEAELLQTAVATRWAERDPWAAGEAMLSDGFGEVLGSVIDVWAKEDSEEASRFINERLGPGEIRDQAVISLISGIITVDFESALEWANSISDGGLRDEILLKIGP